MPFTTPTLAQARTALSTRLGDPLAVRWVTAELSLYIAEALHTWNAWTAYWRDQGSFNCTMLQAFYDLPTVLPTLRAQTFTNWSLVTELQYALIEPAAAGGTWTGTAQFDLAMLSTAIQRRRDQFVRETGSVLTQALTPYVVVAGGRYALDEAVLDVRRAAWRPDATQLLQPLMRTDVWAANHFQPTWLTNGTVQPPYAFSVTEVPPITLQVIPPPTGNGTLDLVSLNKMTPIDPLVALPINVPDDFAWVIKYGALADLLGGDGLQLDPTRAQYCEARWKQGIDMARTASVVQAARISDVPCMINSLTEADRYSPLWQLLAGVPNTILTAGHTLLASWPPPNGNQTVTLDLVRNAPIPLLDADILQVSADVYDAILDLAQHAALFKEGPQLESSTLLLERAARSAGIELKIQQAKQPSRAPLMQQTRDEEYAAARELDSVPTQ